MTNGWKIKTLEEACQFSNGLWKGEKPPFANVGVIRSTNFTKEGTLDDSDIAYLDVEAKKFEKRRLHFGDIILEKSGGGPKQPVGRVALFDKDDGDFSFSNFTAALRVLDPRELDFRFLHKFLHWTYVSGITEGMQSHSTGIRNLDGDAYKTIKISFPPVPEQRRIVGILDDAFEEITTAKANAERNLQNVRALFESYLQSVFTQRGSGWMDRSLGSIAIFRNGINYTKDSKGESIKIFGVRNFQKNFSAPLDDLDTVTIDGELSELDLLKQDDILAVRSNGNIELIGRCLLVGEVVDKISHSGFTIRIRLISNEVLPSYLCYFLKSASSRKRLTDGGTGTNIKSLNQGMLSALTVPFPGVSSQKLITERLESISKETKRLASLYEQKLAALETLKKSLLHQAFSGKL
jgi:type I restriction enzyme, S subunit